MPLKKRVAYLGKERLLLDGGVEVLPFMDLLAALRDGSLIRF